MLITMPDMKWTVYVRGWTWIYDFSRFGTVKWGDPFNGQTGTGNWRLDKHKGKSTLVTNWHRSKTWEAWDMPLDPFAATGKCHMAHETFDLKAVAINFFLEPGDVVYRGVRVEHTGTHASIVYPTEVRSGGTIAWICRNPGNIRRGEEFGAYKGKRLEIVRIDPKTHERTISPYAIFPDDKTGADAIVLFLKKHYLGKTIRAAMHDYAGKGDGSNDPDGYARKVAKGLGVNTDSKLTESQFPRMAELITSTEGTAEGTPWARNSTDLPREISERLIESSYPPIAEELQTLESLLALFGIRFR